MILRPITPADRGALVAFHDRCSDRTHYLRFHAAKPVLLDRAAAYFVNVDNDRNGALVAVDADHPEVIHGVGRWADTGCGTAELAFVVDDANQGHGIGRDLVHATIQRAAVHYDHATAEVLAENGPMLHLLRTAGLPVHEHHEPPTVTLDIDLTPTATWRLAN